MSFTLTRRCAYNGRNYWSSFRYNTNNAWITNGNNGFFNNNNAYNGNQALPVSNKNECRK